MNCPGCGHKRDCDRRRDCCCGSCRSSCGRQEHCEPPRPGRRCAGLCPGCLVWVLGVGALLAGALALLL